MFELSSIWSFLRILVIYRRRHYFFKGYFNYIRSSFILLSMLASFSIKSKADIIILGNQKLESAKFAHALIVLVKNTRLNLEKYTFCKTDNNVSLRVVLQQLGKRKRTFCVSIRSITDAKIKNMYRRPTHKYQY